MDEINNRLSSIEGNIRQLQKLMSSHVHDSTDSSPVRQSDVIPTIRAAAGKVQMLQAQQTYSIGLIDNPTRVDVFGEALFYDGGSYGVGNLVNRVFVQGVGLLGKSFYFQPRTSTSITAGGLPQNIVQTSAYFGVTSNAGNTNVTTAHIFTDDQHIVDVEWPSSGTFAVRATITKFDNDHIEVYTDSMLAGWGLILNFVVT
jgi:hypothetical protein